MIAQMVNAGLFILPLFICGGCAIPIYPPQESYHKIEYQEVSFGELPSEVIKTLGNEDPAKAIRHAARGKDPQRGVVYEIKLNSGRTGWVLEDGEFLTMTL